MTTYSQNQIILHVEQLSVAYGSKMIIENINLTERNTQRHDKTQGQTIAFLGRSGRGKSTLFKALTGLIAPTKGQVLIPDLNKSIANNQFEAKRVREGDVGFVDQRYTLFRNKTIYQAFKYAASKGSDKANIDKIDQYLADWGLEKVKHQYPCELSGGQRQRTAIIEQLLCSGNFIVLDEPFSGLDVGNILNVKDAFNKINTDNDLNTIIFSTHDIELAVDMADSIYIIGYENPNAEGSHTGTIVKHFDLKQLGLAWHSGLTNAHRELVKEIEQALLNS